MKKKFFILLFLTIFTCLHSQNTVTINVTDGTNPLEDAQVSLNSWVIPHEVISHTDANGTAVFDLPSTEIGNDDSNYHVIITKCPFAQLDAFLVVQGNVTKTYALTPATTNNVSVQVGSGNGLSGVTVQLTGLNSYNQTIVTSGSTWNDIFTAVPYGLCNYTISAPCYPTITGNLNVGCMENNEPTPLIVDPYNQNVTTNTVKLRLETTDSSDIAVLGASIYVYDENGTYSQTIVSSADNTFTNVPFGKLHYEISKDCYPTLTGTINVNCNDGDDIVELLVYQPGNNVFFFIGDVQEPGCTINLTNNLDFDQTIVGTNSMGDYVFGVPNGTYSYTISKGCYTSKTGTVVVSGCPGSGIAVSVTALVPSSSTNNVTINLWDGNTYAPIIGATVHATNGAFDETVSTDSNGDANFTNVPFGELAYEVTSVDCYSSTNNSVTVDCNDGNPIITGSPLTKYTTAYVVGFVSDNGVNLGDSAVTVELSNYERTITGLYFDGTYDFYDVPFGTYKYTVKRDCYADLIVENVVIDCTTANAALPGGIGVSASYTGASPLSSNNVFFFTSMVGQVEDCTITISGTSDASTPVNKSITGTTAGDYIIADVPYGTYSYTITNPCYATATGSVTVDCQPMNSGVGVYETLVNNVSISSVTSNSVCLNTEATVTMHGLIANSIATYEYTVNATPQTPITLTADGSGNASFPVFLTTSGMDVTITSITVDALGCTSNPYVNTILNASTNCAQTITSQCGSTLATIDTYIWCNYPNISGVQGFRWRVTPMTGTGAGIPQYRDTAIRNIRITSLANYAFNTQYKVEVAYIKAGVSGSYNAPCYINTPEPTTQLLACPTVIATLNDYAFTNVIPFVKGYRFKVTNILTPTVSQTYDSPLNKFKMSAIPGVEYNAIYNVEVSLKNTDGTYLRYGSVCQVVTPSFPTTQLITSQCGGTYSKTTTLYADAFTGASAYGFLVTNTSENYSQLKESATRTMTLGGFTGLIPGSTYTVKVALKVAGVWGPYGKPCSITLSATGREIATEKIEASELFNVVSYPNPFTNDFGINVTSMSQEKVQINVYDMVGRLVEQRQSSINDLETTKIGNNYSAGIYNIVVSQADNTQTIRVVKN